MGGSSSKKNRNRCIDHCCKEECFNFGKNYKQKFSGELSIILKKNKLEYLLSIIMEFVGSLGMFEIIHSDEDHNDYNAYLHPFLRGVYNQTGLPCSKNVKHKDIPPLSKDDMTYTYDNAWHDHLRAINIVVLGAGGVGKSALTIRFITDKFFEEFDPTIQESYRKMIKVDGEDVAVDILDTAICEEFSSMMDGYIRAGEVFLICFAINDKSSFEQVPIERDRILRTHVPEYTPMILVATKCDLLYDGNEYDKDYFVDHDEILSYTKEYKLPYIETSAKLRKNVALLIKYCFYEMRIKKEMERHNL